MPPSPQPLYVGGCSFSSFPEARVRILLSHFVLVALRSFCWHVRLRRCHWSFVVRCPPSLFGILIHRRPIRHACDGGTITGAAERVNGNSYTPSCHPIKMPSKAELTSPCRWSAFSSVRPIVPNNRYKVVKSPLLFKGRQLHHPHSLPMTAPPFPGVPTNINPSNKTSR